MPAHLAQRALCYSSSDSSRVITHAIFVPPLRLEKDTSRFGSTVLDFRAHHRDHPADFPCARTHRRRSQMCSISAKFTIT